jgi:outer membrane lipoprotein
MRFSILTLTLLLLVTGCVHNISKNSWARVDPTITFDMLMKNPAAYHGKFVVFGGIIAATQNIAEGTRIEIVQYDLDSRELPDKTTGSRGHFMAITPESISSTMCRSGRLITIVGEVESKEVIPLQGVDYSYPVINVKELHLFKLPDEESFGVWVPYIR